MRTHDLDLKISVWATSYFSRVFYSNTVPTILLSLKAYILHGGILYENSGRFYRLNISYLSINRYRTSSKNGINNINISSWSRGPIWYQYPSQLAPSHTTNFLHSNLMIFRRIDLIISQNLFIFLDVTQCIHRR